MDSLRAARSTCPPLLEATRSARHRNTASLRLRERTARRRPAISRAGLQNATAGHHRDREAHTTSTCIGRPSPPLRITTDRQTARATGRWTDSDPQNREGETTTSASSRGTGSGSALVSLKGAVKASRASVTRANARGSAYTHSASSTTFASRNTRDTAAEDWTNEALAKGSGRATRVKLLLQIRQHQQLHRFRRLAERRPSRRSCLSRRLRWRNCLRFRCRLCSRCCRL